MLASQNTIALTTNVNKPSVSKFSGSVSRSRIGLRKALRMPRISAKISAVTNGWSELIEIPGMPGMPVMKPLAKSTARAVASTRKAKRFTIEGYPLGVIGNIAQFWRLTRELDVQALRQSFERLVSLRVLGSDLAVAQRVARLIEPDPAMGEVSFGVLGETSRERADVYVVAIAGPLEPDARRVLSDLSVGEIPLVLVQLEAAAGMLVLGIPDDRMITLGQTMADGEARERLFRALVQAAPDVMLSAGRRHPLVREPVAEHLIRESARVNAQFAAISSLPANLPLIGGLVGDMADVIVLTKNQVLLLFKLAGLYGRDLELGRQLIAEVIPIVGGAFVWRTTARALVGLLPSLLGLLPKTLVAYTGTYVVGQMARYYYHYGHKPPPEIVRDLRDEGTRLARETLSRLKRS
jgi:uncharacterized protein (DUF697 family)